MARRELASKGKSNSPPLKKKRIDPRFSHGEKLDHRYKGFFPKSFFRARGTSVPGQVGKETQPKIPSQVPE